jgi:hypothetical protein
LAFSPESPQLPYRLLLQTLNNIDINEFSITRKIIVSDSPPKNRTLRKTTRRELVTFLRCVIYFIFFKPVVHIESKLIPFLK